ncbi:hypothetical protein INR49_009031 [Caranx melampygus]|nr:hypothetical protein INR49_009031 [Caranx melampygus]
MLRSRFRSTIQRPSKIRTRPYSRLHDVLLPIHLTHPGKLQEATIVKVVLDAQMILARFLHFPVQIVRVRLPDHWSCLPWGFVAGTRARSDLTFREDDAQSAEPKLSVEQEVRGFYSVTTVQDLRQVSVVEYTRRQVALQSQSVIRGRVEYIFKHSIYRRQEKTVKQDVLPPVHLTHSGKEEEAVMVKVVLDAQVVAVPERMCFFLSTSHTLANWMKR